MKAPDILRIAANQDFVVDKFRYSQSDLRKTTKRLWVEGKLNLVGKTSVSFVYRTKTT